MKLTGIEFRRQTAFSSMRQALHWIQSAKTTAPDCPLVLNMGRAKYTHTYTHTHEHKNKQES